MQEAVLKCEQVTESQYIDFRESFIKTNKQMSPTLLVDEKGLYWNGDLVCSEFQDEKGVVNYYINPTYKG